MKTPLRYQTTDFDCGPTSLLNALSFLYQREEIPAELVTKIYQYTLDLNDASGNIGEGGTSKQAIQKICKYFANFVNDKHHLNLNCAHLEQDAVAFKEIQNCLLGGGCAVVRTYEAGEHYVLVTRITRRHIYFFDPYYIEHINFWSNREIKLIKNKPFVYNRRVTISRFMSYKKLNLSLGPIQNRECLLISKK